MSIRFSCSKCGKTLVVPETVAGKSGKCSGCGLALTVPRFPDPAPVHTKSQAGAESGSSLSETERTRIEEEERVRAEARIRAEHEARRRIQAESDASQQVAPIAQSTSEATKPPATIQGTVRDGWTAIVGAVLMAIGVLLPWIQVHSPFGAGGLRGIDTADGKLVGVLTILIALVGASRIARSTSRLAFGVACLVFVLVASSAVMVDLKNVASLSGAAEAQKFPTEVGEGLYVVLVGCAATLSGAVDALTAHRFKLV